VQKDQVKEIYVDNLFRVLNLLGIFMYPILGYIRYLVHPEEQIGFQGRLLVSFILLLIPNL